MELVVLRLRALVTQQLQVILTEAGEDPVVLLATGATFLPLPFALHALEQLGSFSHFSKLGIASEVPVLALMLADRTGHGLLLSLPSSF